jgi:uncharacterized protein YkwD
LTWLLDLINKLFPKPNPVPVPVPNPEPSPIPAPVINKDELLKRLLQLHQVKRGMVGMPAFIRNSRLDQAAQIESDAVAKFEVQQHDGLGVGNIASRLHRVGYNFKKSSENIFLYPKTPEAAMEGWLNSKKHRDNIYGNFKEIGLGVSVSKNGHMSWCVVFASQL